MVGMRKRAGGVAVATLFVTASLLGFQSQPTQAGIFTWLGGGRFDDQQYQQPALGDVQNPQAEAPRPGSTAFHGDELPPDEGDDFTRAWITNPEPGLPTLSTRNIEATKAAIDNYQAIVARGGWPAVPEVALHEGDSGPELIALHKRLEVSGDLVGRSIPDQFDASVAEAVKKFQIRHGLPPTGVIDRSTVDALNVPANIRLQQLQSNLTRLQTLAPAAGSHYVMVNVPAAQVEAVEGGQVVQRHAAVVGKMDRPSPDLSSKIQDIVINPYWYVPKSIIYKDLVPKARELAQNGEDLLSVYHMQAFDQSGRSLQASQINWMGNEVFNYSYRQLPWEENSLGFIKLNFPNKDSVYMHDTPLKTLFGRNDRYESSGCVRVHDIDALAAWLLRDVPGYSVQRIDSLQGHEQVDVKLPHPVPVYFVYVSAWATPDGVVNFRPDIYNRDGAAVTASAY